MRKFFFQFLVVTCFIFSIPAFTYQPVKVYHQPQNPIRNIALIQFTILPSLLPKALYYGMPTSKVNYDYYKNHVVTCDQLVGETIKAELIPTLLHGIKLYTSDEFINLKNQGISVYEEAGPKYIRFNTDSYIFVDYSKYETGSAIIESEYPDDGGNFAKIAAALKVEGVMLINFFMDATKNMYLQAVLFDSQGTLITKITAKKINIFLTKNNFLNNYQKTVDILVNNLKKAL